MLRESDFPHEEHGEQEEIKPTEVWIIDDNVDLIKSQKRGWRSVGDSFQFDSFEKAQEAIENLEEKIKHGESVPGIVFVDGNLDADEGELRDGANVVLKIRQMEMPQPFLIAHSNTSEANERMVQAGANIVMEKGPQITLKDYLSFFKTFEDKRKEQE